MGIRGTSRLDMVRDFCLVLGLWCLCSCGPVRPHPDADADVAPSDADADLDRDSEDADRPPIDADPELDADEADQDPEPDEDPVTEVDQTTWVKTWHGDGAPIITALAVARNGDILAAGQSGGFIWIGRLDAFGNTLWERRYGYERPMYEPIATAVREADDGTIFVMAFLSLYEDLNERVWLARLGSEGALVDQRSGLEGTRVTHGRGRLEILTSGDVLLGGNGLAARYSATDGVRWAKRYSAPSGGEVAVIGMNARTGESILGYRGLDDFGSMPVVAKADSGGEVLWAVSFYVDCFGDADPSRAVAVDDGLVVITSLQLYDGEGSAYDALGVMRITDEGVLRWVRSMGGNDDLVPNDAALLPPDGLALVGSANQGDAYWQWAGRMDLDTGYSVRQARVSATEDLGSADAFAGAASNSRFIISGRSSAFLGTTLASLTLDGTIEGGCDWIEPDDQRIEDCTATTWEPVEIIVTDVDVELVPADLVEHDLPSDSEFVCP